MPHQGLPGRSECAGLLWAYMGPQPAPELPVWEPFTWENGFARSCCPRSRATGSSARRTPSTRCTSSGCTTTGASGCDGKTGPYAAQAPASSTSTSSSTASSTSACARAATSTTRWTVGRVACGRTAFSRQPLRVARADRRREHAQRRLVLHARAEGPEPYMQDTHSVLAWPDQRRERPLDLQPRDEPGLRRLGRAGHDRRPHARKTSAPAIWALS